MESKGAIKKICEDTNMDSGQWHEITELLKDVAKNEKERIHQMIILKRMKLEDKHADFHGGHYVRKCKCPIVSTITEIESIEKELEAK